MSEEGNSGNQEGESPGPKADSITIKKDDLWKYSTFALGAILIIGLLVVFGGSGTDGNVVNNGGGQGGVQAPSVVSADVDDDAVLGDPDAPVTIIEFSDYQCPFCGRFWSQTLPSIKSQYIDTGKVKLVFRDFPLTSIHPTAQVAAEATECVRDQGGDKAFFEMHDKIFENQAQLSEASLKQWARELGYNIDSCLSSGKFTSEVQNDLRDATAAGGQGTPYFVINGKPLSGAQPFSVFQQAIEAEL
jgi:protein-disulfide isomerase